MQAPEKSLTSIRAWFTSSLAFGYPIALFALVWPVLTGLGGELPPGVSLPYSVHLHDLIGSATTALALVCVFLVLKRKGQVELPIARILTIWLMIAALATGVQIFGLVLMGNLPAVYVIGAPVNQFTIFGQLLVFVFLSGSNRELRKEAQLLVGVRKKLVFLRGNLDHEIESNQRKLLESALEVLQPAIDALEVPSRNQRSAAEFAGQLRAAIDHVVRPLSHDLAAEDSDAVIVSNLSKIAANADVTKIPFSERYLQRVKASSAFNLKFFVLGVLVFVLPGYWVLYSPTAFLIAAISALAAIGIWILFHTLADRFHLRAVWLLPVALAASPLAALTFLVTNNFFSQSTDAGFSIAQSINVLLLALGSALLSTQQEIRWQKLRQVAQENDSLSTFISILRKDLWVSRQRLARVLHGTTQSVLQSAVIRLQREGNSAEEIQLAIDSIRNSLNDLKNYRNPMVDLQQSITELKDLWQGVCEVTVTVEPALLNKLVSDSTASGCLDALLREAVSNAVKHAAADEVDIQIQSSKPTEIEIEVRNSLPEGNKFVAGAPSGLGSTIYSEITDNWTLTSDKNDVILKATLAIKP